MVKDDFKIDFKNKKIFYNPEGSDEVYMVNDLYSWLQNLFATRDNMSYQIPMLAMTKTEYFLVNGWTIDEKARKHLKEGILVVSHVITES